jgi:hypothetical protein
LCILTFSLWFGCPFGKKSPITGNEKPMATSRIEENNKCPFTLRLSVGSRPANREDLYINIEVKNTSSKDIGWDREFSVFLLWKVTGDRRDPIEPVTGMVIGAKNKGPLKERFVTVEPGKSLVKTINIARDFRSYWTDELMHPTVHTIHGSVGRERNQRFPIDRRFREVDIEVEYRNFERETLGFPDVFGAWPKDAGLWEGSEKSNALRIVL